MILTFGLVASILSVLIAFSAAKGFWSAPLEILQKQAVDSGEDQVAFEEVGMMSLVTPVPTSTSSSSSSSITTTTSSGPCINGCITLNGTTNGPFAPPLFNTSYNGRNPFISSYPTDQP
jgi:hypothetical protein